MRRVLIRSGIPSLDAMFRSSGLKSESFTEELDEHGISLTGGSGTTSICIAGPDGTGKSALAMHFVSRYMADAHQICRSDLSPQPLAFYVSSDLSHEMANVMWQNFALGRPNTRKIPFRYPQMQAERKSPDWLGGRPYDKRYELMLSQYLPDDLEKLADLLQRSEAPTEIAFIDLAAHTAGDDWGFIERLLATMPTPQIPHAPRHLLVIDAMEGVETLSGNVDAFGQQTIRRNRVAKLMRLARPKAHLVLVVEEPSEGERLAEQFVADVVVRLRATENQGYSRRTIEIEKARGQSHVRGRHPYVVRDGRGSTTGEQINYDDPPVEGEGRWQSYIDVFPSLHALSREVMEGHGPGRDWPSGFCAGFGIRELDEMLTLQRTEPAGSERRLHGHDARGLPCGKVCALIGDANTQKSFVALAFLGHVFHELAWQVLRAEPKQESSTAEFRSWKGGAHNYYLKHLCAFAGRRAGKPTQAVDSRELSAETCRWAAKIEKAGTDLAGAVVLITTTDVNQRTLVDQFYAQLRTEVEKRARKEGVPPADILRMQKTWGKTGFRHAFSAYLESRTVCRRLEIHDTPSPVLFHAIRRSIGSAQQILKYNVAEAGEGGRLPADAAERAMSGWRIRLVIDDFNTVMRTYGRVHSDPLFLPFLLLNLRREGLSSLIVETQSGTHGMPALAVGDDTQSDLRALSDHRIFTWHVPDFFGDHRIAIAAIPPMVRQDRKSPVLVRELEWHEPSSDSPPRVNPEFELYAGLDTGRPTLVPLQVHLYAETDAWQSYIAHLNEVWVRVFDPPTPEFGGGRRPVVIAEKVENYEVMRELCDLHSNTSLDYSLIVQVDEFWRHRDTFRPQGDYLTAPAELAIDGLREGEPQERVIRREWFDVLKKTSDLDLKATDRIPFVWDFGFLALRERLWNEAAAESAPIRRHGEVADLEKKRLFVAGVWNRIKSGIESCTWPELLEAASYVARWESARQAQRVPAFDLAMVAPEAFSCLVLEIWFSEILATKKRFSERDAREFVSQVEERKWGSEERGLRLHDLAKKYWQELYATWLLLVEVLDLDAFSARDEGFGFGFGRKPSTGAVAVRHWYKSAAVLTEDEEAGPVRYCRLPGTFSVRGDWFLATVRGSRSDRLADRALDLLSTPAANNERLIRGLGLPTRDLHSSGTSRSSRLWGWQSNRPHPGTLTYDSVLDLGARDGAKVDFHWLWRSNLEHYYAAAPIWERWLFRVFRRWKRLREFVGSEWVGGFDLYKTVMSERRRRKLVKKNPNHSDGLNLTTVTKLASYDDFQKMLKLLLDELRNAENER